MIYARALRRGRCSRAPNSRPAEKKKAPLQRPAPVCQWRAKVSFLRIPHSDVVLLENETRLITIHEPRGRLTRHERRNQARVEMSNGESCASTPARNRPRARYVGLVQLAKVDFVVRIGCLFCPRGGPLFLAPATKVEGSRLDESVVGTSLHSSNWPTATCKAVETSAKKTSNFLFIMRVVRAFCRASLCSITRRLAARTHAVTQVAG